MLKISVFTLGCKTNYYESLQIIASLTSQGYAVTEGLKMADVFVINTCAITSEAEKKSRQAISRARKLNENCHVIVVGCASEKDANQFVGIKNVTLIKGVSKKQQLESMLVELENYQKMLQADQTKNSPQNATFIDTPTKNIEPLPSTYLHEIDALQQRTRAFIKIQDGCNNFCSYCIVPYLRGRSRSKNIFDIVREVKNAKAKETVLIGIDISQYGKDIGVSLAELFENLTGIDTRFRLGSLEHSVVSQQVLTALKKLDFCPHFHLSLQSGSDTVLKRMNRHYTTAEFFDGIKQIREVFPDVALTTDIIVGFCGETQEEFQQTVEFVERCNFSDIHVFPYSRRAGTTAYNLTDVDAVTKAHRAKILGEVKKTLHQNFLKNQLGQTAEVLIETKNKGYFVGYSKNYTRVYLKQPAEIGSIVKVKLTKIFEEGVIGEIVKIDL